MLQLNNLLPQTTVAACVVAVTSTNYVMDDKCSQLSYTTAFPAENN